MLTLQPLRPELTAAMEAEATPLIEGLGLKKDDPPM